MDALEAIDEATEPQPWDDMNPRFHLFLGRERRYYLEWYAEAKDVSVAAIIHALIDGVDWPKRIREEERKQRAIHSDG